jgi:hypothetical protein
MSLQVTVTSPFVTMIPPHNLACDLMRAHSIWATSMQALRNLSHRLESHTLRCPGRHAIPD